VHDETAAVRDEEYRPLFLQGFLIDVTDRHADDAAFSIVEPPRAALRSAAS